MLNQWPLLQSRNVIFYAAVRIPDERLGDVAGEHTGRHQFVAGEVQSGKQSETFCTFHRSR